MPGDDLKPKLRGRSRVRVVVFNVVGAAVGLALVAIALEGWARTRAEFRWSEYRRYIHPRAGRLYVPGSEGRHTNVLDFWAVSRANRWGFFDRSPPPLVRGEHERHRERSCRVAVVGDSFVDAREVPISDKLQVRFEEMARSRLPALRVSASAYGHSGTAQINQLGFYDEFISRTAPDIVVLVFVTNDFIENFSQPRLWVTATRSADRNFELLLPGGGKSGYALDWRRETGETRVGDAERRPGWYSLPMLQAKASFLWRQLRPSSRSGASAFRFGEEALEYTGFAFDQWKARSQRDNFSLVVLASYPMRWPGNQRFDRLSALATARDIPVISQAAYIRRQGADLRDARFALDAHWSAQGHQWAAETLFEWLEQNQDACAHAGPKVEKGGSSAKVVDPGSRAGF